ncbi:WD40-repeat-containing domain protein [Paraphysoderma sedebokerense]|nr:WD40-repeat-containing domain protein [Paraphysoderma sedebokerense]
MNLTSSTQSRALQCITFNQDFSCFSVGLDDGYRIFSTQPFKELTRRKFTNGVGPENRMSTSNIITNVAMLYRSNIICFTCQHPPQKLFLYDDLKGKPIVTLEFRSPIKNVKLRRDSIIVTLKTKIYVYSFGPTPKKLISMETAENELGLMDVSSEENCAVAAVVGRTKGHVQIINFTTYVSALSTSISRNGPPPSHIIPAHTAPLVALALSRQGNRLATASVKGTLIRVFDTLSGKLLNELRRGMDRAVIFSIAFNDVASRCVICSDKSTVHVFNLVSSQNISNIPLQSPPAISPSAFPSMSSSNFSSPNTGSPYPINRSHRSNSTSSTDSSFSSHTSLSSHSNYHPNSSPTATTDNPRSSLSFLSPLLPKYFSSEWSFAHFRIPSATTSGSTGSQYPNSSPVSQQPTMDSVKCVACFLPPSWSHSRYSAQSGDDEDSDIDFLSPELDEEHVLVITELGDIYQWSFDVQRGGEGINQGKWKVNWKGS